MGKMETAFRLEIVRLAKKELRAVFGPVARDVHRMKRTVSHLVKTVAGVGRVAKEWSEQLSTQKGELRVSEAEVKAARLSPALIQKLRKRLGLSQQELALLVGVSSVAAWSWETGRSKPTQANRAALVALRKLGRRDVRGILERKTAAAPKVKRPKKSKARPRKKARAARKAKRGR